MANKVLSVIEQREGIIKKISYEAVSVGVSLAKELNLEFEAVVIGSEIEGLSNLGNYGAAKITHLKNADLHNFSSSAYSELTSNYAKEVNASVIILGNTSFGNELTPRIAVKLNSACIVDCINLTVEGDEIIATRPVYAGKAYIKSKLHSDVKIYTIRPNVFKAEKVSDQSPEIKVEEISNPNLKTKVVAYKKSEGKLDVAEANIIVAGGRGMKGPEHFNLIESLAEVLGAAVGASRAVVDAGWRPHSEQVGQTGKTVSPSLYIACGISGAIQHLAGMSSSKYIVAINKDKDAPIFSIADYGIAGDVFEILPVLTEEIKKIKS
ncbi:MAG TPA: electron transfer flavoprotein subunit alpha/FixB family protein [Ignavibacteriaceae bacterium]|jgi:electron transfer flavoprotein alpha subunit|nr:MAG: Acryloyl-CoA reductase electron transfer subunit beta [Ignavibacteria bacterium ADurb.Bin266]OQY74382.1 MAG: electron transfer flavoprotein subunit alpha [Ignavibacteriales bacterium UTCHB2]HQF42791.1 electron transfer flavoprotein subunit alpha/FixB family protein [Ignavibacteriaceae bacterium]HQI40909.1 electron transfer flavoprotein subunit alpha/FixB family protein [Ignavibacteriaceae bacterium]HQJ47120.1 electron transfer flavoprotein subunit alpha/FixB family protein [Ignavibacter